MKTTERVEQALKRVKELLTLVADWTKQPKNQIRYLVNLIKKSNK